MEGSFRTVMFDTQTRVVAGSYVAIFQAGVPRQVNDQLYRTAMSMGATEPAEKKATPAPKPKKRRSPRQKAAMLDRSEPSIVAAAVEFIEANQDSWDAEKDYDPSGIPRMTLFKENVPGLTTALRDQAWDLYMTTVRQL